MVRVQYDTKGLAQYIEWHSVIMHNVVYVYIR